MIALLLAWAKRLAERRDPDFVIGWRGAPYMRRWWLLPDNRWFNVYLHQILRSDDDRALHDHPFHSISLMLDGGCFEVTARGRRWVGPGALRFRGPWLAHRLELANRGRRAAWTLFIRGPRIREWGFYCASGWVPWQRYVSLRDGGSEIGAGCG